MFGWSKPKVQEQTLEQQIAEIDDALKPIAVMGEDCDIVTGAQGDFGFDPRSPVPVNGIRGGYKYINRLSCRCGLGLMFHRLGSFPAPPPIRQHIDVYETVCCNAIHWANIFIHCYHPRRSRRAPSEYSFKPWHPVFSVVPIGMGTTSRLAEFPVDLPHCLAQEFGQGPGTAIAATCAKYVGDGSRFKRPTQHANALMRIYELLRGHTTLADHLVTGEDVRIPPTHHASSTAIMIRLPGRDDVGWADDAGGKLITSPDLGRKMGVVVLVNTKGKIAGFARILADGRIASPPTLNGLQDAVTALMYVLLMSGAALSWEERATFSRWAGLPVDEWTAQHLQVIALALLHRLQQAAVDARDCSRAEIDGAKLVRGAALPRLDRPLTPEIHRMLMGLTLG